MNPDALTAGAEVASNLAGETAGSVAPAALENATPFTPDAAGADTLAAAVGGGAEQAYADEIMGFDPVNVMKNMDTILPDVAAPQSVAAEVPPVDASAVTPEGSIPVDTATAEGTVPPVDGNPVEPPASNNPVAAEVVADAAADGEAAEVHEEAPDNPTNGEPTSDGSSEPESVRDELTSRIETLKSEANPTPEQQRELSKASLELAERDRRDTLNAAEPDSLSTEDAAERDKLNEKFGTPNTSLSPEDTLPDQAAAETSQEPVDPGEFDEQAARDQIEADRNRKDWSQDQKDAEIGRQRAEHDKKKDDYEKAMKEKEEKQEMTTEQQKQKLDQELKQVQQDLIDGKITAREASDRLTSNRRAREILVKSLVERFQKGEEMTPYEKEVAEKSIQMQQLMREIQMAPKVMTAMEQTIKKLKADYTKAAGYQITPQNADSQDTRQNVALRSQLSNQIAAQATHMARYADITSINVNEFKSVNSSLMNLVGVRGGLRNMMVQIGTGIRSKAKTYEVDLKARRIAQGKKV